ncbi:DUF2063 domain-containing protein [Alphaproteobacteria bacterium LSUCC0684]
MPWQDSFANALSAPGAPVPLEMRGKSAADIERRFNVYRNNIRAALTGALSDNFPVVQELVGEEFFRALAGVYIQTRMPTTPVLALYGDGFADFIDGFPPVASLPYLGDIARLEYARQEAFTAADRDILNRQSLACSDTETLLGLRLQLHPSLRLICSRFPIHAIWRKSTDTPETDIPIHGQTVLVSRRQTQVETMLLAEGGGRFFMEILGGASLGEAASAAVDDGGGDHLDTLMVLAISHATDLL